MSRYAEKGADTMVNILWTAFALMLASGSTMLLINAYRLVRTKSLHKEYKEYFDGLTQGTASMDFVRRQSEVKDLLAKSGVGNPILTRAEPLGLGQVHNYNMNVIDNMVMNDQEVVQHMVHLFYMAEGTFSFRIRQSINPIFWLETVIFLPSLMLGFVGVSSTSPLSKTANVVGWVMGTAAFVFSLPDFYVWRDAASVFFADLFPSNTLK